MGLSPASHAVIVSRLVAFLLVVAATIMAIGVVAFVHAP
jgi:hypothetical protein